MYLIIGQHGKGRGYCGHLIRGVDAYGIVRVGNELHALCNKCRPTTTKGVEKVYSLPKDLVDGVIPIV